MEGEIIKNDKLRIVNIRQGKAAYRHLMSVANVQEPEVKQKIKKSLKLKTIGIGVTASGPRL